MRLCSCEAPRAQTWVRARSLGGRVRGHAAAQRRKPSSVDDGLSPLYDGLSPLSITRPRPCGLRNYGRGRSTDRGGLAPALARCELLARTYLPLRQVFPQRSPHPQTAPYFSPQSSSIRKQTKKATPGHSSATMNAIRGYVLSGCGALVPAPLLFACLGPTHGFCLWIL